MSILEIRSLSFSFGDRLLYSDVDLDLNRGDHMGLVGANGTGKSTFLRLLRGDLVQDSGTIIWQNRVEVGYIDQYSQIEGHSTIRESLRDTYKDLYEKEARMLAYYTACEAAASEKMASEKVNSEKMASEKLTSEKLDSVEADLLKAASIQEELERLGFYDIEMRINQVAEGLGLTAIGLDRSLESLSSGQRTKVLLARMLLKKPDVLLLDEPINFLDTGHVAWLSEYLSGYEGAYIVISHDFQFLEEVSNCICCIEYQKVVKYHGRYSDFVKQADERKYQQRLRYDAQQKEIEKLEKYIEKNRYRASTARMAQSRIKKLDKIERIEAPDVEPEPRIHFPYAPTEAIQMLEMEDLLIGYDRPLLPPFSLKLLREKVALVGFNGIGKSTMLKTLMAQIPSMGGRFVFPPKARIGYFEQDLIWGSSEMTPLEIMTMHFPGIDQRKLRSMLARCGIRASHVIRPIKSLSGGEQNKVKLCLLTMRSYNILLLDEPTNHLDDKAKASLAKAIRDFPGAVLLVCHEEDFYKSCTERVIRIGDAR